MTWRKTAIGYATTLAARALRRDAARDRANGGYGWAGEKDSTADMLDSGEWKLVDAKTGEGVIYRQDATKA